MFGKITIFLALSAALVAAGCDCDGGTTVQQCCPDCSPTIEFQRPTGNSLSEFDDANDDSSDGIQYAVRVQTIGVPEGTTLTLNDGNGLSRQADVVMDDESSQTGHVDFGEVDFQVGTVELCVVGNVLLDANADGTTGCEQRMVSLSECKSVQVQLGVPACRFESPTDGATLTASDDSSAADGFQYDVSLVCKGVNDGEAILLSVADRAPHEGVLANASVMFDSVDLEEGSNVLTARTKGQDGSDVVTQIGVTVDTGACAVRLIPVDGTVLKSSDDEDDADGLQITATVETDHAGAFVCADGSVVTVHVNGEAYDAGTFSNGQAQVLVTVPDGTVNAYAEVSGSSTGRSVVNLWSVCATELQVNLEAPADGMTIRDIADQDEDQPGIQFPVTGTTMGVSDAESCWVELDGEVVMSGEDPLVPAVFFPGSDFEFDYLTCMQSRTYTIEVKCVNACGDQVSSEIHTITCQTEQVTCEILDPTDGASLLSSQDTDADPANGLQYQLQIATENVPDGAGFTILGLDAQPQGASISSNAWTGEVTIPEGSDVQLQCQLDSGEISPVNTVCVDSMPPVVSIVSPSAGTLFQELTADVVITTDAPDGVAVIIDVSDGTTTNSYQGTVNGGGATVAVTLLTGEHVSLTATVWDGACGSEPQDGNFASSEPVDVSVIPCTGAPVISYTNPVPADPPPTIIPNAGASQVCADITEIASGQDVTLTVLSGGQDGPRPADVIAGSSYCWNVVYSNGNGTLTIDAQNACGASSLQQAIFVGNPSAPTIAITSPAPDSCSTQQDVQVVAATTNTATGDVCYFCRRVYTGDNTIPECNAQSPLRYATDLVDASGNCGASNQIPSEGDWQIWASVTNSVPLTSTSQGVVTRYDVTEPAVSFAQPSDGAVYNLASVDADPGTPGFQIAVTVSSNEDGTLDLSGHDGIVSGPTWNGSDTFDALVTLSEGDFTLEAQVADCAGNTGQASSIMVTVDRVAPDGVIDDPDDLVPMGLSADSNAALPGFQHDVTALFTDAQAGDQVCVERNINTGGWSNQVCHTLSAGEASNGYTFVDYEFLPQGQDLATVQIRITTSDPAGNSSQDSVTVPINLLMPNVTITRPEDNDDINLLGDMCADPGVQVQVNVETANTTAGDLLVLCECNGSCPVADPQSSDLCARAGFGTEAWVGSVTGVTTPIACVDLAEGDDILIAYSENLPDQGTFSAPVLVHVDGVSPTVENCVVTSDADSNGCIDGTEGSMVVTCAVSDGPNPLDGQTATLRRDWPPGTVVASGTISSNSVTITAPLSDGDYAMTLVFADLMGNLNIRSDTPVVADPEAQFAIRADSTAPSLTITSPLAGVLNLSDDDNPGTQDLDTQFCVSTDAEDGQIVSLIVDGNTIGTPVSGGVACTSIQLGQGDHHLYAVVEDTCGNSTTSDSVDVTVDTILPTISCSQPSSGSAYNVLDVPFTCTTSEYFAGQRITVVSTLGGERCQQATDASGTTSFTCNLQTGTQDLTLTVADQAGNISNPLAIDNVTVDVTGCQISLNYSGNKIFNASDDKDANPANGLQVDVTVCSTDCANCCTVKLYVDSAQVGADQSLDASGCTTFTDVTFADSDAGRDVEAHIIDQASNDTYTGFSVELVDLYPPTITRLTPGADNVTCVAASGNPYVNGTDILADKVAGAPCEMDLQFRVTDGGDVSYPGQLRIEEGGVIAGPTSITSNPQDVLYANQSLAHDQTHNLNVIAQDYAGNTATLSMTVEADVVAPAEITDAASSLVHSRHADVDMSWSAVGDDGASGTPAAYIVKWADAAMADQAAWDGATEVYSGTSTSPSLQWLPPLHTYHFAVRAQDEVGNMGPLPSGDVPLDNNWTTDSYTGPGGNFGFSAWSVGDVNNDTYPDFVVSAPTLNGNQGSVFVFYGGDPLDLTSPQELNTGQVEVFGWDVTSGDLDGDGINDLVVTGFYYDGGNGRVTIFWGQDGAPLTASQSMTINGVGGGQFGRSAEVLGDITNDSPTHYADLFVGAPVMDSNGRGYIFYGRSRTDWASVSSATDADVNILGINSGDWFGYRHGATSLGDMDGDGYDDFALVASAVNEVYTFDGQTIKGIGSSRDVDPATDAIDTISYGGTYDDGTFKSGFGMSSVGGVDFTNDSRNDLVIGDAYHNYAYLFQGMDGTSPSVVIDTSWTARFNLTPAMNFGWDLAGGDINMDGWMDLLVGTNSTSGNRAALYLNSNQSPFFDAPGAVLTGGDYYGIGITVGDFDNDTLPDLVITSLEGGTGMVYVIH